MVYRWTVTVKSSLTYLENHRQLETFAPVGPHQEEPLPLRLKHTRIHRFAWSQHGTNVGASQLLLLLPQSRGVWNMNGVEGLRRPTPDTRVYRPILSQEQSHHAPRHSQRLMRCGTPILSHMYLQSNIYFKDSYSVLLSYYQKKQSLS